jgi:hypothetical protein
MKRTRDAKDEAKGRSKSQGEDMEANFEHTEPGPMRVPSTSDPASSTHSRLVR